MERKIVTYGGYFEAFMETLTDKEQEKIQYGLLLLKTQYRLPKKFVKLIREGIYELTHIAADPRLTPAVMCKFS